MRTVDKLRRIFRIAAPTALCIASPAAAQDWTPVERSVPYAIRGDTAPELYASIGERGPKAGIGRAIAVTNFKLTWKRDYRRDGTACVLAAARPTLVISYSLPQPSAPLPDGLRQRWATFHAGLAAHEKEHGRFITEMVERIVAGTVGFRQEDDPGCKRIYQALVPRLKALSDEQRERSRAFDREEMRDGGAVHRLILDFLNGP